MRFLLSAAALCAAIAGAAYAGNPAPLPLPSVRLQPTTPGTAQTGHSAIAGIERAGGVVAGDAGVTTPRVCFPDGTCQTSAPDAGSGVAVVRPVPVVGSTLARWAFDEGPNDGGNTGSDGGTFADSIGNNRMIRVDTAAYIKSGAPGYFSHAVYLGVDTSPDGLHVESPTALQPTGSITVHGWLWRSSPLDANYKNILSKKHSGVNDWSAPQDSIDIWQDNSAQFTASVTIGGTIYSVAATDNKRFPFVLRQWNYFALVVDTSAQRLTFYVNGFAASSTDTAPGDVDWNGTSGGPWGLGNVFTASGDVVNNGLGPVKAGEYAFDEWRIESRAMSATEVEAYWRNGPNIP